MYIVLIGTPDYDKSRYREDGFPVQNETPLPLRVSTRASISQRETCLGYYYDATDNSQQHQFPLYYYRRESPSELPKLPSRYCHQA
jgi:hypothetical protein